MRLLSLIPMRAAECHLSRSPPEDIRIISGNTDTHRPLQMRTVCPGRVELLHMSVLGFGCVGSGVSVMLGGGFVCGRAEENG